VLATLTHTPVSVNQDGLDSTARQTLTNVPPRPVVTMVIVQIFRTTTRARARLVSRGRDVKLILTSVSIKHAQSKEFARIWLMTSSVCALQALLVIGI